MNETVEQLNATFKFRNFFCPVCHGKMDYCGFDIDNRSRFISIGYEEATLADFVFNFYCKTCNANMEYTRLED
jgi:hypothetical protein